MQSNIITRRYIATDFDNIFRKCRIAGHINAPDQLMKTLVAYDRDTGILLGASVWDPETGDYEIYCATREDGKITLIARDEGGNFNADVYDRLTQAIKEFSPDTDTYSTLLRDSDTLLCKVFSVKQMGTVARYPFNVVKEDLKEMISAYVPDNGMYLNHFVNSESATISNLPSGIVTGTTVNDVVIDKIDGSKIYFGFNHSGFKWESDVFEDSSCIRAWSLNGHSIDSVTETELAAAINHYIYGGIYKSALLLKNNGSFDTGVQFSGSFAISFNLAVPSAGGTYDRYTVCEQSLGIALHYYRNNYYLRTYNGSAWNSDVSGGFLGPTSTMHHYVLQYNAATTTYKLYIDGIQLISGTNGFNPNLTAPYTFRISGCALYPYPIECILNRVRVFNRALTVDEITYLASYDYLPNIEEYQIDNIANIREKSNQIELSGLRLSENPRLRYKLNDGVVSDQYNSTQLISIGGTIVRPTFVQFDGITGNLWRGTALTDLVDANVIDESNVSIAVRFYSGDRAAGVQCIWKSGDSQNGIAIGFNDSNELIVSALNNSVQTTGVYDASSIGEDLWYYAYVTQTSISLYDTSFTFLGKTEFTEIDPANSDGRESIAAAIGGSPLTATAGDGEYFIGAVSDVAIYEGGTLVEVLAGNKKIAIEYGDTGQQCYVEVVKWNVINNEVVLWAKVPTINASEETVLRIYFGADHEDNTAYIGNVGESPAKQVWTNGFQAVYHMQFDPITGLLLDSTQNEYHLTPHNIDSANLTAHITGYSLSFDGIDEYVTRQDSAGLRGFASMNIGIGFNPTTLTDGDKLIDYASDSVDDDNRKYNLEINTNAVRYNAYDDSNVLLQSIDSSVLTVETDYFLSIDYDAALLSMRNEGVEDDSIAMSGVINNLPSGIFTLGRDAFSSQYFEGNISELFISNQSRSADWDKLTALSMKDQLGTYSVPTGTAEFTPIDNSWNPSFITTTLWLDAADSNTITLDGSSLVEQWSDKSGNDNHAVQATSGNRPPVGTINDVPALAFDGTSHFMTLSELIPITSGMSFFAVFTRDLAGTKTIPLTTATGNGYPYAFIWWTDNDRYASLGNNYSILGTPSTDTGAFIVSLTRSASDLNLWETGTDLGTAVPSAVSGALSYIGRWGSTSTNYHAGKLAEIILIDSEVSLVDRQRIEGYLAHKWGLLSDLPEIHPYKIDAPTYFAPENVPFAKRINLAVDATSIPSSLSDFPITIHLDGDNPVHAPIFESIKPSLNNLKKIAITQSDAQVPIAIEYFEDVGYEYYRSDGSAEMMAMVTASGAYSSSQSVDHLWDGAEDAGVWISENLSCSAGTQECTGVWIQWDFGEVKAHNGIQLRKREDAGSENFPREIVIKISDTGAFAGEETTVGTFENPDTDIGTWANVVDFGSLVSTRYLRMEINTMWLSPASSSYTWVSISEVRFAINVAAKAIIHARIAVAAGGENKLVFYYDDDQEDNIEYVGLIGESPATNVWNGEAPFSRVWYTNNNTGIKDGAGNVTDIIPSGTIEHVGPYGKDLFFNDGADYIPTDSVINLNTQSTIEFLVRLTDDSQPHCIVAGHSSSNNPVISVRSSYYAGSPIWIRNASAVEVLRSTGTSPVVVDENYYHFVIVDNGSYLRCYVNGIEVAVSPGTSMINVPFDRLMLFPGAISYSALGYLRYVAISPSARSEDWIKATYLSLTNQLITASEYASSPSTLKTIDMQLDSSLISEDQYNFPLTVILDGNNPLHADVFTKLGNNNRKISITDAGEQLPIEIEYWSLGSAGEATPLLISRNLGSSDLGSCGLSVDGAPIDNGTYYTFDGIDDGLYAGKSSGNDLGDSSIEVGIARFRTHNKLKGSPQIIWKDGGVGNGVAIGIDASGNLGLFGRNNSAASSITIPVTAYEDNVWYVLWTTHTKIVLVDDASGQIVAEASGTCFPGDGTADESIGFAGYQSPITSTNLSNIEYFEGDIDYIDIYDSDTVVLPTKKSATLHTKVPVYSSSQDKLLVFSYDPEMDDNVNVSDCNGNITQPLVASNHGGSTGYTHRMVIDSSVITAKNVQIQLSFLHYGTNWTVTEAWIYKQDPNGVRAYDGLEGTGVQITFDSNPSATITFDGQLSDVLDFQIADGESIVIALYMQSTGFAFLTEPTGYTGVYVVGNDASTYVCGAYAEWAYVVGVKQIKAVLPSFNVWDSGYALVYHMSQNPSSLAPQLLDSTANAHNGTAVGGMTANDLITSDVGQAIDFDGTDDYISVPDHSVWDIGTNDFSIIQRVTLRDTNGGVFYALGSYLTGLNAYLYNSAFYTYVSGAYVSRSLAEIGITAGVPFTLEVKRVSGMLSILINGVVIGAQESLNGSVASTQGLRIGYRIDGSATYLDGIIDEFRVSAATRSADYSKLIHASFENQLITWTGTQSGVILKQLKLTLDSSVITEDQYDFPLTIILDGADPLHADVFAELGINNKKISIMSGTTQLPVEIEYWENLPDSYTKLLIHSNDVNGSTSFIDSSDSAHTITPLNCEHVTAFSKFGLSSMFFNGASTNLTIPASTDFIFDTGPFCVELYFRPAVLTGDSFIFSGNSIGELFFGIQSGTKLGFGRVGVAWDGAWNHGMSVGNWYHICLLRMTTVIGIYVNGVLIGSVTNTATKNIDSTVYIGSQGSNYWLNGYIDEMRVSKGNGRYAGAFTPPPAFYSKAVLHTKVPIYSATADGELILSYDSSNADNVEYVGETTNSAYLFTPWNNGNDESNLNYNRRVLINTSVMEATGSWVCVHFMHHAGNSYLVTDAYIGYGSDVNYPYFEAGSQIQLTINGDVSFTVSDTNFISDPIFLPIDGTKNIVISMHNAENNSRVYPATPPDGFKIWYDASAISTSEDVDPGTMTYTTNRLEIIQSIVVYDSPAFKVWDNNFAAVYHMSQDPSGGADSILDSTSNHQHGTPTGTLAQVDGVASKAINFNNSLDGISLGTFDPFSADMTVEALIKLNASQTHYLLSKRDTWNASNMKWQVYIDASTVALSSISGSTIFSEIFPVGEWATLSISHDSGGDELSINGMFKESGSGFVYGTDNAAAFCIGKICSENYGSNADIDELRFSTIARSADWITLTHLSLTNQLITYEQVTETTEGSFTNPLPSWSSANHTYFKIAEGIVANDVNDIPIMLRLSESSGITAFDVTGLFTGFEALREFSGNKLLEYKFGSSRNNIEEFNVSGVSTTFGPRFEHKGALYFNGNAGSEIDISAGFNRYALLGSMTLSLWFNPARGWDALARGIFGSRRQDEICVVLGTDGTAYVFSGYGSTYNYNTANGSLKTTGIIQTNYKITTGWIHLVYVRDDTAKVHKLMLNGQTVMDWTSYTYTPGLTSEPIYIGYSPTYNRFLGAIADIQIFDGILDDSAIAKVHESSEYAESVSKYSTMVHTCANDSLLGDSLNSINVVNNTQNGTIAYTLSFDGQTYSQYIDDTWEAIVSNDPAVHGYAGETDWFYKNINGLWERGDSNLSNNINKALIVSQSVMTGTMLNSLTNTEFVAGGYDSSTGYVSIGTSIYASSASSNPNIQSIRLNNNDYWVSEAYALDAYDGIINTSKVMYAFKMTDDSIDYDNAIKVYCHITGDANWTLCTNGAEIPGITAAMDTIGKSIRFRIVWDADLGVSAEDISLQMELL